MQLSQIMCTENWSTFHNYFGSSGLLPARFGQNTPIYGPKTDTSLSLEIYAQILALKS